MRYLIHALLLALTHDLPAQVEIATGYATAPWERLGQAVVGFGDGDGDGRSDFLVASRHSSTFQVRVQLFSGRTRAQLGQVLLPDRSASRIGGVGDLDQDGQPDFALVDRDGRLRGFTGDDATPLWTSAAIGFLSFCGIDDVNGDGRDEVAAIVNTGQEFVVVLDGRNGAQLNMVGPITQGSVKVLSVGDITGSGSDEIAVLTSQDLKVYRTAPLQLLGTVSLPVGRRPYEDLLVGNAAGDARPELWVVDNQSVFIASPVTLTTIGSFSIDEPQVTLVGDLDGDGYDDLATDNRSSRSGYTLNQRVTFVSGVDGRLLASWGSNVIPDQFTGVGDVDGDGFGDLLIGNRSGGPPISGSGAWQLVSGRIRARVFHIPVQCTAGPFPPVLGVSPPVLGQQVTFVGRDCPPGATGILAVSRRPDFPINLGFQGCDAWWDVSNWNILHLPPPGATWTHTITMPGDPGLAGLGVALQAFYVPTATPIGFDLSSAVWARFGF